MNIQTDRPQLFLEESESALLGQYLKLFWEYKKTSYNNNGMDAVLEATYHAWFTEAEEIMPLWARVIVNEIMHNLDTALEGDAL